MVRFPAALDPCSLTKGIFIGSPGYLSWLSPDDLLREFSCRRGHREHLWSKVLSDTTSGCFALFGVNKKRLPETAKTRTHQAPAQRCLGDCGDDRP